MCETESRLKKRHKFLDFLYWNLVASVPLITACIAIGKISILGLILYLTAGLLLIIVLLKFYCTRCPHYTREGKRLKCIFFWGMPKFFAPRPGALSAGDKLVAFTANAGLLVFPI